MDFEQLYINFYESLMVENKEMTHKKMYRKSLTSLYALIKMIEYTYQRDMEGYEAQIKKILEETSKYFCPIAEPLNTVVELKEFISYKISQISEFEPVGPQEIQTR